MKAMFIDSEWKQEKIKRTKIFTSQNTWISVGREWNHLQNSAKNGESIFITNDPLVYDHHNSFQFSDTYLEIYK